MTSTGSYRITAILVASLFLITAAGAIAGNALMAPVTDAPDYLSSVFPKSGTVTTGMLLWLINDIGIVFIGLLMFPLLRRQNEAMALGYVSMRMFESIFMIIGVIFALLLIPLSREYLQAGAPDIPAYQAIGAVLQRGEYLFLNVMQLIPLGLGGIIFTSLLYQTKLVPRFISVIGIIGYALLLPDAVLTLFGIINTLPGSPGSIVIIPVVLFECILMPIWLYAKGFNVSLIPAKQDAG